ncbi:hypothetical protein [Acinetobacter baumannii]|uniref:hypothetical protein n=1 Tax=Acinetobacter baumannii TaxID=470 RepID=UPI002940748B|nr:hypothetical protein [Acinetobacter baumannii]MDV4325458.1 hypothetical protein [Acinetobacter baumannii]
MYRVWIEEEKAPDGVVEIEYETLDEAKAALKVLEILAWNRSPWLREMHPNAGPHEIAKEYVLCGILEKIDGKWVDYKVI